MRFSILRPTRGRSKFVRLFQVLGRQKAYVATSLTSAVAGFVAQKPIQGVIVVLSDFLFPNPTQALSWLVERGNQVVIIQVLSPEEIRPDLAGDLELVDAETGERREVSMGSAVFRRYIEKLARHREELSNWAKRTSSDYFLIPSGSDLTKIVLKDLRGKVLR